MANGETNRSLVAKSLIERALVDWEADLKAFLLGVLRNVHLADEAYQRTVVKAIEACNSAHAETLRGWLFQIAMNEARQLRRAALRESNRTTSVTEGHLDAVTDTGRWLVENRVVTEELIDVVRESMGRLSENARTVVRMRLFEGLSFEEIAGRLNEPLGTVLARMHRSIRRLRDDPKLKDLWEK